MTEALVSQWHYKNNEDKFYFCPCNNDCDVKIFSNNKNVIISGLDKKHIDASVDKGFIMFFEMNKYVISKF